MTELFSHPIEASRFRASAAREGNAIRLTMGGAADLDSRDALEHTLATVDREMVQGGLDAIVVDLRELRFLNSSCLKSFIGWISHIQERPPSQRYFIRFISNPAIPWQHRSLHAIRCFADTLITIEE